MTIFLLDEGLDEFPSPLLAEPTGLLAVGGGLSLNRLLNAYRSGIFPWFSDGDPVLWWSPDPRLVLYPAALKISKSLRRVINKRQFIISFDTAFSDVITACAAVKRKGNGGTWITDDMIDAYCTLHEAGWAHSVEAWDGKDLVGGLYGVSIGQCFFGESMFTLTSNAAKTALVSLVSFLKQNRFRMIDCQMTTPNLLRFGAEEIPRYRFLSELETAVAAPTVKGPWRLENFENDDQACRD